MFGWVSKLSDLHVKCATLFERVGSLAEGVNGLADDLHDVSVRVGRVEGAIVNSSTPEVLRQLSEIQQRISIIESRLDNPVGERPLPGAALVKRNKRPQLKLPKPLITPGA
jgi:hypothetical protein